MQQASRSPSVIRFAVFELDIKTRELRKHGVRLKLAGQAFQILELLVEKPGEVVTRDQLRLRLWPADTYVDFDHSLNATVNRAREALGDSAENPRFIETVPKRGYRFIAPVYNPHPPGVSEGSKGIPHSSAVRIGTAIVGLVIAAVGAFSIWREFTLSPPRIVGFKQITDDRLPKNYGMVTDGARIYFGSVSSGRYIISQVSAAGGETAMINTPVRDPFIEDISPEQSDLLVQTTNSGDSAGNDAFWLVPVPAGPPRRLGGIVGHGGRWAPDRKLVFGKGHDLYLGEYDGGNARKLTTAPGFPAFARFSPDGQRIRFTVFDPEHTSSIWEVQADGRGLHALFPDGNNPRQECCGNWTLDGRYYVFQSVRDDVANIWAIPDRTGLLGTTSGPKPVQLTSGPLSFTNPIPSKDGKKLFVIGARPRAELNRYDKDSGDLVPFLGGISAGDVDFSRDGQWVSYVTYPDDLLWRSKSDGSEPLQLTFPPMRAVLPHWSPDGQRIAFTAAMPGTPWKIRLVAKDGGSSEQLTSGEFDDLDPTWSQDGNMLAFGRRLRFNETDQTSVQMLDLNTHQSSQLLGSQGICWPRWSPNGRYIAALPFHEKALMLFDFKSHKWRQLITHVGTIGYFAWSPDSGYLYFGNVLADDPAYLRVRISDSKLDQIASLRGLRLFIASFGITWTGLAPGETPLFVRDIGTQEIYALDLQAP